MKSSFVLRLSFVAVAGIATLAALPAAAQQRPGTQSPAGAGRIGAAADSWGTYVGASAGDTDFDFGGKAFVGQQFHPNLGWEAQVVRFGERDERRFGVITESSAWSIGGSVLGILPLNEQFSVFGKVGLHYVNIKFNGPGVSSSDGEVDPGIGVGGRFRLNSQLSFRLELEDIGDAGDMISFGVQYRFQ
jgi:OOP family OmpA-OmpF porin